MAASRQGAIKLWPNDGTFPSQLVAHCAVLRVQAVPVFGVCLACTRRLGERRRAARRKLRQQRHAKQPHRVDLAQRGNALARRHLQRPCDIGNEFLERVANSPRVGPGKEALETAQADGTPVILVTAHLGNYDAVRGTLSRQGYRIGALYKPMANPAFNTHYVKAISALGEPLFPTDRKGIVGLVRHLKSGGMMGIVADVGRTKSPVLKFFGLPAHTPLSTAEWALQEKALLIPVFGIRQPDGVSFEIRIEAPIAHSTPEQMMQDYNDIVERIVREDPGQWFWIHNRWKLSGAAAASLAAQD